MPRNMNETAVFMKSAFVMIAIVILDSGILFGQDKTRNNGLYFEGFGGFVNGLRLTKVMRNRPNSNRDEVQTDPRRGGGHVKDALSPERSPHTDHLNQIRIWWPFSTTKLDAFNGLLL
jgi:hypothetical protein